MRKFIEILKWIGLFIWQIPQNIVALVMLPFMGKMKLLHKKRYSWCILCEGMKHRGSISLGNFVLLGSDSDTTIGHELGHVKDSHWIGPLYLFIIGLPSILWAAKFKTGNYYKFFTERRANKNSHIVTYSYTYESKQYWDLRWEEGWNLDSIK